MTREKTPRTFADYDEAAEYLGKILALEEDVYYGSWWITENTIEGVEDPIYVDMPGLVAAAMDETEDGRLELGLDEDDPYTKTWLEHQLWLNFSEDDSEPYCQEEYEETETETPNPQAKLVAEIKPSTWELATDLPDSSILRAVLDCLDDETSDVEEAIEVAGARLNELIDGFRPLFWTEAERAEHDTLLKNYGTLLRTSCFLTTGIDPAEVL